MPFPNMRKTFLFFLLLPYKLSFCPCGHMTARENNDYQSDGLLISEVLFNPKIGGVDFIEIYNASSRNISLNDVQLANLDAEGNIGNIKSLGTGSISSRSFLVISTSSAKVKAHYYTPYPDLFLNLSALPAYNSSSGNVILLQNNNVIDRLDYTEKMHLSILNTVKGVSLERVSFNKAANETGNFVSAAASVGFATPGYINSVQEDPELKKDEITINTKIFSPDGDGFDDTLKISWKLKHYGNIATVSVFSDRGLLVRKLIKNESIAVTGTESWDGLNDRGEPCPYGIYFVVFNSFDINGSSVKLKKAFAVAGKFK